MTDDQIKATAVAYMTALNARDTPLAESIVTDTFDHDQLTEELLDFISALGEMVLHVIDGFSEGLGHCPECVRSKVLEAFGQDAVGGE